MMSEGLYFIALLPPGEVRETIIELKNEVAARFASRHALRSPPHITLHMPFRWKKKKEARLMDCMEQIANGVVPFPVELKDFGFFASRVVFVDVVKNSDLDGLQGRVVQLCRRELHLDNANYRNRTFHPHVTVAFRDLKKAMFHEAKAYFEGQTIGFRFEARDICLLKHDGSEWNVFRSFGFSSS